MFIHSNILFLRERKGIRQEDLAEAIGSNRSTINSYERSIGTPPAEKLILLSDYFGISIDSLLKVDLKKLTENKLHMLEEGNDVYITGNKLRVLAKTVDSNNRENIELVPVKAIAGYTRGYNDKSFVETLPTFQLPFLSREKKYRGFQLEGDSMLPIPHGAYVIGEYVENWQSMRDGRAYILITEEEGMVFKIVYNQVRKKKNLLLKSLNPQFQPYEVEITDIREVWEFVNYISAELPEPASDIDAVFNQLAALNKKLKD